MTTANPNRTMLSTVNVLGLMLALVAGNATAFCQRAEDYLPLANDGAWCWFSDPRAVYHHGTSECLYAGWVSARGDIVVGSYNYRSGLRTSTIVQPEVQKDDHINPSLLFLPDGRLMVFFTRHNGGFSYTTSLLPENIGGFQPVKKLEMGDMLCYTNPVLLSEEGNRIYVFFRGGDDWKPSLVYSDDLGKTWSKPRVFVAKPGAPKSNRPYFKVSTDGRSRIHFAFTDGHPRNEPANSVSYLRYEHGSFCDASGKLLGTLSTLPVNQDSVPRIYDGRKNGIRSWIWDLAVDRDGRPVVVYATFPAESRHQYNYASWDGVEWDNHTLCDGGSWFPRYDKKKEEEEPEPFYSGGICLDHANTNVVYVARPNDDKFELERWETSDHGLHWSSRKVTSKSDVDNVRPFVASNCPAGKIPRLLWMHTSRYRHYTEFQSGILLDQPAPPFDGTITRNSVSEILAAVAHWQMDHFPSVRHHELDWTNGALFAGLISWAWATRDSLCLNWLEGIGRKYAWQPGFRMYHADDICVAQMYLELYRIRHDEQMIIPTRARADWVIDNPSQSSLMIDYATPSTLDRWSWCDALFMAPPVYARLASITGNPKYLSFMMKEYQATYDYLYDKGEHLFFRDYRYFAQRESNAKKVFWGRGNGWVLGGLVAILKELPKESEHRPFFVSLFKEMSERIASLQNSDGFWHSSLLDPGSYPNPETSSSSFFCYALAYGVNDGLLERERYMPNITNAWQALVGAVSPDGKLGWVQPIGADPKKVDRSMTEVYGVGAFLLAGTEVMKLVK